MHLNGYMLEVALRWPCPPLPRPSICSFVDAARHLESTLNFYHSLISHIQIHQHVFLTSPLNSAPEKGAWRTHANMKLTLPAGVNNKILCSDPDVSCLLPAPMKMAGYLASLQAMYNLRPFTVPDILH